MTFAIKDRVTPEHGMALLVEFYEGCYLNTTLVLSWLSKTQFVASNHDGDALFSVSLADYRRDGAILLKVFGDNGFSLYATSLDTLILAVNPLTEGSLPSLPPATHERSVITLYTPDWFTDPQIVAWLNDPENKLITQHRQGEFVAADCYTLLVLDDHEASDLNSLNNLTLGRLPEPYRRIVKQIAAHYRSNAVLLKNAHPTP